jgi:hypothetical protein
MSVDVGLSAKAVESRPRHPSATRRAGNWSARALLVVYCLVQTAWIVALGYGLLQAARIVADLR